jgi:hypothetical protein
VKAQLAAVHDSDRQTAALRQFRLGKCDFHVFLGDGSGRPGISFSIALELAQCRARRQTATARADTAQVHEISGRIEAKC